MNRDEQIQLIKAIRNTPLQIDTDRIRMMLASGGIPETGVLYALLDEVDFRRNFTDINVIDAEAKDVTNPPIEELHE